MKKVLIINTIGMGYEGMSSVIINYLANINRDLFHIDIVIFPDTNENFKKKLAEYSNIVELPDRKKNIKEYIKRLGKTLAEGYDVLHIHGNSATMLIEVLIGKRNRVNKIITHVHNTRCEHPFINSLLRYPMCILADVRVACSEGSGKYLYKKNFIVLQNAIDLERFSFDEKKRKLIRSKLGLEDQLVIGHIGSFIEQKNHEFLIKVYEQIHIRRPDSVLLLLSDGPKKEEIENTVKRMGLENNVIFAGRCGGVEDYYQGMDIFVLPSKWEGLPLVMLEAQASGLPVFASDCITREACCTKNVYYLSLFDSSAFWAETILSFWGENQSRKQGMNIEMEEKGFNIKKEAQSLEKLYCF